MKKFNLLAFFYAIIVCSGNSQHVEFARRIIDTLCSESFHGRGYVNNGDKLAAQFIEDQFRSIGLQPINNNFKQKFGFTVNTFPGAMEVKVDELSLVPGRDFLITQFSRGIKGNFCLTQVTKKDLLSNSRMKRLLRKNLKSHFLVVDLIDLDEKQRHKLQEEIFIYKELAAGLILLTDKKLTWGQSNYFTTMPILEVKREVWPSKPKKLEVVIENKIIDNYETFNVIGIIPSVFPSDSFIVFTAHFDHLGRMGRNTMFPGANDNASGTAMLLALAKYFKLNPSKKFNYAFIAFAAEEMGLLGSKHFVENPLFDLKKIKFLINLDLVGTGDEGITVVNSPNNQKMFDTLLQLNAINSDLKDIKPRKNAPNSDHFPFTQKSVPAVFIYAMGGIQAYHDIFDKPETLPLTKFDSITNLIINWVQAIQ